MPFSVDKPYGTWIKPDGEVIICVEQCSHQQHCRYEEAQEEGWICTIEPDMDAQTWNEHTFCVRYQRATVTVEALREQENQQFHDSAMADMEAGWDGHKGSIFG